MNRQLRGAPRVEDEPQAKPPRQVGLQDEPERIFSKNCAASNEEIARGHGGDRASLKIRGASLTKL